MTMLSTISTTFTEVLGWLGEFLTAMTSESGELVPLMAIFAIGIGVTIAHFCGRFIKGLFWGA